MKRQTPDNRSIEAERGTTIIEIIIALFLVSILGLAVAKGNIVTLKVYELNKINRMVNLLLTSRLEELTAVSPSILDETYNEVESNVMLPNSQLTFTRTVVVTVEPNDSRTIVITVDSNKANFPKTETLEVNIPVIA